VVYSRFERRIIALLLAQLGAQSWASAEQLLDLDGYVAIVLRAHPATQQSAALDSTAAAERRAARLLPDPVFEVSGGRGTVLEAEGLRGTETGFSISQSLPWITRYQAGKQVGERASDFLRASADAQRWELKISAREAFVQLLRAHAVVEISKAAESDARWLRDLATRRAELGESREIDRLKAEVEWLRQRRNLQAAEREADAAEAILRRLAVVPLPQPLVLQGELPAPVSALQREALLERLASSNPALRAAQAEKLRQAARAELERSSRYPDIDLSVFRQHEIDKRATGVAVGLVLPLWNARRGEIARAEAGAALAEADFEAERLALQTELEARSRDVEVASSEVAILVDQVLPAAAGSLQLARLTYEEGETSLLDLLDAQRTHRDTQREAIESRFALAAAVLNLQRLVGPDFDPWR
jgi:cobalt-zinc-cadmium efflux system outer membrane protein